MAKTTDPSISKYFQIVKKINSQVRLTDDELKFYYETTPEIDKGKIDEFIEASRKASKDPKNFTVDPELSEAAIIEAGRMIQSDPVYKQQTLDLAQSTEAKALSDKFLTGINLVLGATDVANSINQIRASKEALKKSRKPGRPAIPQRDQYLQNALRNAEEATFDSARALAPVQQQIQDQYLSDVQDAKTAATGQAGAYGAYRQLAANRRNRAATQLAPIQDQIRRQEQARYDNLLGMRADETQQMFQNQASLYGNDLDQYNREQQAIGSLGATGRENLRGSLYNIGGQVANTASQAYTNRRYRDLYNKAVASGVNPKYAIDADKTLQGYWGSMTSDDTPNYWEQAY